MLRHAAGINRHHSIPLPGWDPAQERRVQNKACASPLLHTPTSHDRSNNDIHNITIVYPLPIISYI